MQKPTIKFMNKLLIINTLIFIAICYLFVKTGIWTLVLLGDIVVFLYVPILFTILYIEIKEIINERKGNENEF